MLAAALPVQQQQKPLDRLGLLAQPPELVWYVEAQMEHSELVQVVVSAQRLAQVPLPHVRMALDPHQDFLGV